ncbi:MAG: hypothetical protein MR874_01115 [Coriobacteriaceae bacterium]|nr:hypothetical protein [Coriobacteriaceae bacterium]MCI6843348.1 hypothetical protein [Coriobacteriaceae bacterium]
MAVTAAKTCGGACAGGAGRLAPRQWPTPREARGPQAAPMPVMLRRSVLAALWTVARDATDVMVRSAVAASLRDGRVVAPGSAYDAALEAAHADSMAEAHARAYAIGAVTSAFVRCPDGFGCDDLVRACDSVPSLRGLVRSHPDSYVLTVDTALPCLLERAVREREIVATRPRPPAARAGRGTQEREETGHGR